VRLEPDEFGDVGFLGEGCGALFFVLGDAFGYGAGYADMEDSVFSGHEVDGAARKKGREKEKAKERKSKRKKKQKKEKRDSSLRSRPSAPFEAQGKEDGRQEKIGCCTRNDECRLPIERARFTLARHSRFGKLVGLYQDA
jgi:hypothetical protein